MENQSDRIISNIVDIKKRAAEAAFRSGRKESDYRIMAVTKTVVPEIVNLAIENGITLLGENKAQELSDKYEFYKGYEDIHFIGHLQTNKVKYIINKVSMIESVDSIKLAKEISRLAGTINKSMDVLIEINIGNEPNKSGVTAENSPELIKQISVLPNIKVKGLMTIPPVSLNIQRTRDDFKRLKQLLIDIRDKKIDNIDMCILSMGMSYDFEAAIEEGSNIVRIGTAMFGKR